MRGAEIDGANLAGAEMHGATGLSVAQLCSARWQDALLDAELLSQVQVRCSTPGASANALRPAPQVNDSPAAAATVVGPATPAADVSKLGSVQQSAPSRGDTAGQPSVKSASEKSVSTKTKHSDTENVKETTSTQSASGATKTKKKSSAPENPKAKTDTTAATASAPQ
jgi:hypothetical protein